MDVKYFCRYCGQSYVTIVSAKSCEEGCAVTVNNSVVKVRVFETNPERVKKTNQELFEEIANDTERFGINESLLQKDDNGNYRNMIVDHYFQFFCEGLKR